MTSHRQVKWLVVVATFMAAVLFPPSAYSQTQAIGFRAAYTDFRFDEVAKSFVTQGGDLVQVVRDRFAGTGGIGGEMIQFSESGRFMFSASAEYLSSNLFGSSGFKLKYSPGADPTRPGWGGDPQEFEVKDQSAFFRTTMGFGVNLMSGDRFFLYANPNLDIQYGQRVYLEDAYRAFVDRGFSELNDFKVDNSLLLGGVGRLHAGAWLSESIGLSFSPGIVWSYRFDESYTGYQYNGVQSSGSSYGYDFAFGLLHRIGF